MMMMKEMMMMRRKVKMRTRQRKANKVFLKMEMLLGRNN